MFMDIKEIVDQIKTCIDRQDYVKASKMMDSAIKDKLSL